MLDVHTQEHGYTEVYVPYLVNAESMRGTGQPRQVQGRPVRDRRRDDLYLIPDRRVPVTNIVRGEIVT